MQIECVDCGTVCGPLDRFMTAYVSMLSQSHAAKDLWKGILGKYPSAYSGVRWFSKAEIAHEFAEHAHLLPGFVTKLEE